MKNGFVRLISPQTFSSAAGNWFVRVMHDANPDEFRDLTISPIAGAVDDCRQARYLAGTMQSESLSIDCGGERRPHCASCPVMKAQAFD
jgi:hypothetical protein